jgi:hypothetical protein
LGGHLRLNGKPSGYEDYDPFDLNWGLGAWYSISEGDLVGLIYQRSGLGRLRTPPYGESASIAYDLDTLWLAGRLMTSEAGRLRPFVGLALGGSLQEVHANGAHVFQGTLSAPEPFACSAIGPGFSLAATGGLDVELAPRLALVLEGALAFHLLDGGSVGNCAQGAGSVLGASARLGFAYRFGAPTAGTLQASAEPQ